MSSKLGSPLLRRSGRAVCLYCTAHKIQLTIYKLEDFLSADRWGAAAAASAVLQGRAIGGPNPPCPYETAAAGPFRAAGGAGGVHERLQYIQIPAEESKHTCCHTICYTLVFEEAHAFFAVVLLCHAPLYPAASLPLS